MFVVLLFAWVVGNYLLELAKFKTKSQGLSMPTRADFAFGRLGYSMKLYSSAFRKKEISQEPLADWNPVVASDYPRDPSSPFRKTSEHELGHYRPVNFRNL